MKATEFIEKNIRDDILMYINNIDIAELSSKLAVRTYKESTTFQKGKVYYELLRQAKRFARKNSKEMKVKK